MSPKQWDALGEIGFWMSLLSFLAWGGVPLGFWWPYLGGGLMAKLLVVGPPASLLVCLSARVNGEGRGRAWAGTWLAGVLVVVEALVLVLIPHLQGRAMS